MDARSGSSASCIRAGARPGSWPHAPVLFELALDAVLQRTLPAARTVSRQQPAERDIAVVVKEGVTHAQLMQSVHAASTGELLRGATLFDIYRPGPAKSTRPA
jgi:phenylalanyl-tRNA synthetase beta chain